MLDANFILTEKKEKLYKDGPVNHSNASLLSQQNIWSNVGVDQGEDNFNLEYMDLDEFLNETGLLDANFANLINNGAQSGQSAVNSPQVGSAPECPGIDLSYTQIE